VMFLRCRGVPTVAGGQRRFLQLGRVEESEIGESMDDEAWEGGAHRGQASVTVAASQPMRAAVVWSPAWTRGSRRVRERISRA
jgi:hypothetical protein